MNTVIFWLASFLGVFTAVAINLDCRARNIAARIPYTISAIFFPIIVGIIYALKRKGLRKKYKRCGNCGERTDGASGKCPRCGSITLYDYKPKNARLLSVISIVIFVIGAVGYSTNIVINYQDIKSAVSEAIKTSKMYIGEKGDTTDDSDTTQNLYYDKNGMAYSDYEDVVYYDRDGGTYLLELVDGEGEATTKNHFINTQTNEELFVGCCYVDSEGYFCFIDDGSLELKQDSRLDYYHSNPTSSDSEEQELIIVTSVDKDGNLYYKASEVQWKYNGEMLINGESV